MGKFASLLSAEGQALILRTSAEMARIFHLSNRFLGRAILDLSRNVRNAQHEQTVTPGKGYAQASLTSIMPGLAARLGETGLTADEENAARSLPFDREELRNYVGNCMKNSSFEASKGEDESLDLRLLRSDIANGNPITIALDRVAPPVETDNDWTAKYTREISRVRFGDDRFSSWTPEMQEYGRLINPFEMETEVTDDDVLEP